MTPNEYVNLAVRTRNPALTPRDAQVMSILGLCGEFLELSAATDQGQLHKELGDVLWYIANVADTFQVKLPDIWTPTRESGGGVTVQGDRAFLRDAVLALSETCKKAWFHGHPWDQVSFEEKVHEVFAEAFWLAYSSGTTLHTIAEANIEKLRKRYPEGFDTQKSLIRKEG